jgi:hypothetical protein
LVSNTLNIPTYTLAGLGGISLTSLSATTPLSYNNTTGAFTIAQATTSTDGYLSSTDWNTFNGKQSALTFSSPLVNTAGTVSIPAATTSVNGYLTSTDWTTFNNKQNALTNPVTGTGTSGQVTYFNGTSTVTGSANLFWDNTNGRLGINQSSLSYALQVYGSINFKGNSGYNGWVISQAGGNSSAAFNLSYGSGGASNVITAQYDTGFVGIGTANPQAKFELAGSSGNFQIASSGAEVFFTRNDNNDFLANGGSSAGIRFGGQQQLRFATGTSLTTRMTIDVSGNIGAPSGTNIYNASDKRLKQNIVTIENGLEAVLKLNPVKFNWLDGYVESEDGKDMLGFIAQEVENIIPEAVENFGNNSVTIGEVVIDNPLRVNEKFIIPVLVKAIQELSKQNEELSNRLIKLESK